VRTDLGRVGMTSPPAGLPGDLRQVHGVGHHPLSHLDLTLVTPVDEFESSTVSGLSCSGLVTTPTEVVEEGSGFGGDAGLGGHLLGADSDGG